MNNVWILAQAAGNQTRFDVPATPVSEQTEGEALTKADASPDINSPVGQTQKRVFDPTQLIFLALLFVVMYLLLFRGPRKKQQQHKQMVQSLQKNDRVQTIGGIIGTIVDVKGNEITLKIDESNNTKVKITPSAIGKNLSKDK